MKHKLSLIIKKYQQPLKEHLKDVEKTLSDKLVTQMIVDMSLADPDQQQLKSTEWIIKTFLKNGFLWEDVKDGANSKVYHTLSNFLKYRKYLENPKDQDIMRHNKLSHIASLIREHIPEYIDISSNKKKTADNIRAREESLIVRDDDYFIVIPKTEFASCFWGRNTEWCTASTQSQNYFDHYHEDGPIYICITPDNKKYQFHINSEPMDENDEEIRNVTDPVLVKLCKINHNYQNIHIDLWDNELYKKNIAEEPSIIFENNLINKLSPELILYALEIGINDSDLLKIPSNKFTKEIVDCILENYTYLSVDEVWELIDNIPDELKVWELYKIVMTIDLDKVPERLLTVENISTHILENLERGNKNFYNDFFQDKMEFYYKILDKVLPMVAEGLISKDDIILDDKSLELLKKYQSTLFVENNQENKTLYHDIDVSSLVETQDIIDNINQNFGIIPLLSKKQLSKKVINHIINEEPKEIIFIPLELLTQTQLQKAMKNINKRNLLSLYSDYLSDNLKFRSSEDYLKFFNAFKKVNNYIPGQYMDKLSDYLDNLNDNTNKDFHYLLGELLNNPKNSFNNHEIILQFIFNHPEIETQLTDENISKFVEDKKIWKYLPSYILNQYTPVEERINQHHQSWGKEDADVLKEFNSLG